MSKVNISARLKDRRIVNPLSPTLSPSILSHTINIQIRAPPTERGSARGESVHYRDANGTTDPLREFSPTLQSVI